MTAQERRQQQASIDAKYYAEKNRLDALNLKTQVSQQVAGIYSLMDDTSSIGGQEYYIVYQGELLPETIAELEQRQYVVELIDATSYKISW